MAVITGNNLNNLLSGTNADDIISGLGGNDVLFGSRGDDLLDGGADNDTANYGSLNRAITLRSQGVVDKSFLGTDQIVNIENIVGAVGKRNAIDGTVPGFNSTRFIVDLSRDRLAVLGIPGIGQAQFGVTNFVDVTGTTRTDRITGNSEDNIFGGSRGKDVYDGKGGNDTVDYTGLGEAITLERAGIIDKGSQGQDTIKDIETIIGDRGFANAIDGSTGLSGTTAFELNLATEDLGVSGIPGLGSVSFKVKNFLNATGTTQSDKLTGNNRNNIFGGSRGNDAIDGANGRDVADYTDLGEAVTLRSRGVLDKGSAGVDQLTSIETIIGAAGFDNTIDAFTDNNSPTTSVNVNLATNRLVVQNIPVIGNQRFTVENFVNVTGTNNNDRLVGDSANNILVGLEGNDRMNGGDGNDSFFAGDDDDALFGENGNDRLRGGRGDDLLNGGAGRDILIGVNTFDPGAGSGEIDRLIGGADADRFVLGDSNGSFYQDAGNGDFARIIDLQTGLDKIVLAGSRSSYSFDAANKRIFLNTGGGVELIAQSQNAFNVNTDFAFA